MLPASVTSAAPPFPQPSAPTAVIAPVDYRPPAAKRSNTSGVTVPPQAGDAGTIPPPNIVDSPDNVSSADQLSQIREEFSGSAQSDIPNYPPGWWNDVVTRPLRREAHTYPLSLEQVLVSTLNCSKQVQVFSELPLIRETAIVEADAAFDWSMFLESRWRDLSDPVGSTLTAGPGVTRYSDHHFTGSAGLRKRTLSGAQLEVRQDVGWQDTNSVFFVPDQQGTSRLVLSFTQPLLRGHGEVYNTSLICLAQIDSEIAHEEFLRQLQSHLLEVTRAYWALYLERGTLYQKLNSYRRAKEIVKRLSMRQALDASAIQVQAAEAALTERRAELLRADAAARNAEARLRALVNDPSFGQFDSVELVPTDLPLCHLIPVDVHYSLGEAMASRPEVTQALKQIRAAAVRINMADNELLPQLNLVTEAYVAGLSGNGDVGTALGNQFTDGRPGYSVGLLFDVPLGNRAATARMERRQIEMRQLQSQYEVTLQTVGLEVEVAVREVQTSQQELRGKAEAVAARERQLHNLEARWERLPGEDLATTLLLENILTAQDRLADAEFSYLQSQVTYNLSLTNLKRATGTLLQDELVDIHRFCSRGTPAQGAAKPEIVDEFPEIADPVPFAD
ncbi:MAG: TolC family protein [Planctomycetaceae bacterium]|nr:TolC family protein [Planctomycetaceae bacterium]